MSTSLLTLSATGLSPRSLGKSTLIPLPSSLLPQSDSPKNPRVRLPQNVTKIHSPKARLRTGCFSKQGKEI